jgi:hypothetical protein
MIPELNLKAEDADAIYQMLVNLHARKSPEESALLNSKLVLVLASYINDVEVLNKLFALTVAGS